MAQPNRARDSWIIGGALVSLAALAFSILRGNRLLGRLTSGFAGAFLEKWGDIRLERKVARILAKAEAEGKAPEGELGRLWSNP